MLRTRYGVAKLASALALILTIFSAGIVISHQCHVDKASSSAVMNHLEEVVSAPTSLANTGSIAAKACATLFFIVLLVGRKYLSQKIQIVRTKLRIQLHLARLALPRPPNFHNSLSLSQLGIIRI
jgi:hypothetical protein